MTSRSRPAAPPAAPEAQAQAPPLDLADASLYTNRELSWLDFNQRVLDQALDEFHPLLERVKFLAIVGSNLDEFFMVRVATHLKKQRAGLDFVSVDGLTVSKQLAAIRARASAMAQAQAACWEERLRPALATHGVRFLEPADYTPAVKAFLSTFFKSEIYPLLTPLAFDPGHPFPLISNRSKNFAVVVRHRRRTKFARVKIPALLPRFVPIPDTDEGLHGTTFAFLEDVIRLNLPALFPGVEVVGAHLFRVIRDADIELPDDGSDDLMESVDRSLKRMRHGALSLLEVEASMPRRVLNILVENFEIEDNIVARTASRLDFSDWMTLHRLPLPQLKDAPFIPRALWNETAPLGHTVFDDIREQDRLVHHPFESFSAVEAFVGQAATDPQVVGIKMTLYRIGSNSPLIDTLIAAADAGKQVAVLVELKARFDERTNIQWATRLEEAGVHVVYGVENLKTHCKLCLIVRKESDGIRRYAHLGTGNYNRATAQVYTDFGLFTANPRVLDDVSEIFNQLTGYSRRQEYHEMLVAPTGLRSGIMALLEREMAHAAQGRPARIIIKNNALTDPLIVRALYRASQAGVEIDLIVRGACILRTGIPNISNRIRVRSVVGRFLEHSRIYYFENAGEPDVYFGSADLMERNLDRRVETLCRVVDRRLAEHIRQVVLETYLADTDRAYVLHGDRYERVTPQPGVARVSAQDALLTWYTATRRDTPAI